MFSGHVSFGIWYISNKGHLTFSNLKNRTASLHFSLPLCQLFATAKEKCIYKNQTWDLAQKAQKQISMLEQGWQCCIHSFKAGWYSDFICTPPQEKKYFQGFDRPTHELGQTKIQITKTPPGSYHENSYLNKEAGKFGRQVASPFHVVFHEEAHPSDATNCNGDLP